MIGGSGQKLTYYPLTLAACLITLSLRRLFAQEGEQALPGEWFGGFKAVQSDEAS